MVKNLPAMQETWVQSLGWEDPLEKETATHSSILTSGKPHRQRSLVGYSPWGHKELDATNMCKISLLSLYAEYIMRNAGLEEAQAGIKIATRSINNLRYADDTILMAESEEELNSLLMKVKDESEKLA